MKRLFAPACLLACLTLMISCSLKEKAQNLVADQAMQEKIKKLNAVRDIDTLDAAEREKKELVLMKELIKEYPPLPPIGRDSMERVFLANVPKEIEGYKLIANDKKYRLPDKYPGLPEWDTSKPYFFGTVRYDNAKARQSMGLNFLDFGYAGKWYSVMNYNMLMAGDDNAPVLQGMSTQLKFQKVTDYAGQRWSQWKPKQTTSKDFLYLAVVNDRFIVTVAAPNLDFVDKVIDREWVNKLK